MGPTVCSRRKIYKSFILVFINLLFGTHPTVSKLKDIILLPKSALPLLSLILIHDTIEEWKSSQPATANQEPSVPLFPGQLLASPTAPPIPVIFDYAPGISPSVIYISNTLIPFKIPFP